MTRYVIVGNSAGGIGAAEAIREVDRQGQVTIISDEPYATYSRPLISEYLAGEKSLPEMLYRDERFYQRRGLEARLGQRVRSVDPGGWVELDDGQRLEWDRLILATGGQPIVPPMAGRELQGVYTFTTLGDARAIAEGLAGAKTAVVIGGGLIGLSVTEALVKRGLRVHLVELKERVLSLVLDEPASRLVEERLRQAGVDVLTGLSVRAVLPRAGDAQRAGGVVLSDGRELACDLAVVAVGVAPRVELAREAGLAVNRGIVVDRQMATSVPGIYACGDAAEAYDFMLGANRVVPIWPNAYLGGRIAGLNAAGGSREYAGGTSMNSLNYFGLCVASAGELGTNGHSDLETVSREAERGRYRKVVLKDDCVVGFVMAGEVESAGLLLGLMRDGVPVRGFERALASEDFRLIALPASLRRERLSILR